MVLKSKLFEELEKGDVQGFRSWIKIQLSLDGNRHHN